MHVIMNSSCEFEVYHHNYYSLVYSVAHSLLMLRIINTKLIVYNLYYEQNAHSHQAILSYLTMQL